MKRFFFLFIVFFARPVWGQDELIDSLVKETIRLESYADSCFTKGDINAAKTIYSQIHGIWKNNEIYNERYAKSLYDLCRCLNEMGNYSKAIRFGTEALEIVKRTQGDDNVNYVTILNSLAVCYSNMGNYSEAIRLETEVLDICKKTLGNNHPDYAMFLNNLANFYSFLGFNEKAAEVGKQALEIRKDVLGINHPDYATSLNNLGVFNREIGNYTEALKMGTKAVEIRKKIFGENPLYAMSLANLASTNFCLGNYDKAIEYENTVIEILKKYLGINSPIYAMALSNQALYNAWINDLTEAIKLEMESLRIRKAILGSKHPDYASSLNNISTYYGALKNFSKAIHFLKKAIKIRKESLGINHPDYIQSLSNLALYYFCINRIDDAIQVGEEVSIATKNVFGPEHSEYARVLQNLSSYHIERNNYQKAIDEMNTSVCIRSKWIISNFAGLSSQKRYNYWNKEKDFFLYVYPKFAYKMSNSDLISNLYDKTTLLAKGILINTDVEMKRLIEESGDSLITNLYQKILSNYEIYNTQATLPIANRMIDVDSLKLMIEGLENELIEKLKSYGDYMRNLRITWKDIQQRLNDDDLAIEFMDFPVSEDSTMYVALTLKKGYSHPRMIPLFEISQLKSIHKNTFYRTSRLAKLVWGPLEDELKDAKNVFFSPSGELHKIGIEYLPLNGEEYIFNRYKLVRLSSTRQLVTSRSEIMKKQAVIYGGIDYDAPLNLFLSNAEKNKDRSERKQIQVDSLPVRGGREYLEGTKIEADSISSNLRYHKWDCSYYMGANGTENSFKMMSGNSPSLLHIATHGFYMTEEDARKERELVLLESKKKYFGDHPKLREDKPMTRSGLLLSGCNHALNHEDISEHDEDGILTAQEIATLDLRGLDLVVLSACETGLGDITSGEGVFGLQRGFKKAGANTIIMSLWKVSDKATEKLMTTFYSYYLNGMSKLEAFTTAREELRKTCSPRQNKPDWAAFIMLDGIK